MNQILKTLHLIVLISIYIPNCYAQDDYVNENYLRNTDFVYKKNIKSAQLYPVNDPLAYPIINLNGRQQLALNFDDLDADVKEYNFTVKHFRSNWEESDLSTYEYIEGFSEEDFEFYNFSYNTLQEYTHYETQIPNDYFELTKSGNYLLIVYEDGDIDNPILTKRFCVTEQLATINNRFLRPNSANFISTHQRLDFELNVDGIPINNPYDEVKVNILQNGKWDPAIIDLTPATARQNRLLFNKTGKQIFEAGKEFRYVDLRSYRFKTNKIKSIESSSTSNNIILRKDEPMYNSDYDYWDDINGKYVVEIRETNNDDLQADYANVNFSLAMDEPLEDANIYVYGALSEWNCNKQNQMTYNYEQKQYECDLFLKQGFYNYQYVAVFDNSETINEIAIDGSHYNAENDYLILSYFRPFNARYDRLIGYKLINSLR